MMPICAWCKKVHGEKESLKNKDSTHGICPDCADILKTKYKISALFDLDDIETVKNFLAEKTTR